MTTEDEGWKTWSWSPPDGLPPPDPPPPPPPMKRRRSFMGVSVKAWVLGLGVAGAVALLAILGEDDDDESASFEDNAYSAHAACAEFTRDRLKAPGSADFPEFDDRGVSISHAGNRWTVRSFVDAENSFGANIRTSFLCVIADRGDTWRLESWSET